MGADLQVHTPNAPLPGVDHQRTRGTLKCAESIKFDEKHSVCPPVLLNGEGGRPGRIPREGWLIATHARDNPPLLLRLRNRSDAYLEIRTVTRSRAGASEPDSCAESAAPVLNKLGAYEVASLMASASEKRHRRHSQLHGQI